MIMNINGKKYGNRLNFIDNIELDKTSFHYNEQTRAEKKSHITVNEEIVFLQRLLQMRTSSA